MQTPDLSQYFRVIEDSLIKLNLEPDACITDPKGVWTLKKGSATIDIGIYSLDDVKQPQVKPSGKTYICVSSWILRVPEYRRCELFEEILNLNSLYIGVTFALKADWVLLKADREIEHLDVPELVAMVNRVANISDYHDDFLKGKYL